MFSKLSLRKSFFSFLAMMSLLVTVSGCGDLFTKKVVKRQLESTRFRANCSLDVNEFGDILHKNISSQIKCLEENLNLFIRVVESKKPGYLGRAELEQYIRKNMPEIRPEIVKALKSIFDLNFLITGEDPEYISQTNVESLIKFLLTFNAEAALNFGPIFQSEAPVSFALHQNHRDRVSSSAKTIVMSLRNIFNSNRRGEVHKINIPDLLESFTTEDTRENVEKARKLLFVKKVILGGEREEMTHLELERILLNFEQLVLITLDAVRYKYIILKQESLLQLLRRDIFDLYDIIYQGNLGNRDSELFFTIEEAFNTVELFVEEETFNVDEYRNLILEAKKIVMGGTVNDVKGLDFKNFMNHAKAITQTGVVFHRIYDKFKIAMESHLPVTINFDEYRHTYPEHQQELAQFERIVKRYRFFKGEFKSAYYTRGFRRNADGIFEVSLIEYALRLLFNAYGSPTPGVMNSYSMDQHEFKRMVFKFEEELIKMGLILPRRASSISDTISLLGSLFQYQSDKNKVLDVNEGTEFAVALITSLDMSKEMMAQYKQQGCQLDRFNRIEPNCFKENFFPNFCKNYRTYYPLLFEYLGVKKCEEYVHSKANAEFLWTSIEAGRKCNYFTDGAKEEIWYSEADIMIILMSMFHAETTVLRWDANGNNILDVDEVDRAYSIYEGALDGFLQDKPSIIKRFKKQIYQYLIKYEKVPDEKDYGSVWKFVKFLMSFNKKSPATRKTITAVLRTIGEQNKKLSTGPQFDCNWLRDPENIPRE